MVAAKAISGLVGWTNSSGYVRVLQPDISPRSTRVRWFVNSICIIGEWTAAAIWFACSTYRMLWLEGAMVISPMESVDCSSKIGVRCRPHRWFKNTACCCSAVSRCSSRIPFNICHSSADIHRPEIPTVQDPRFCKKKILRGHSWMKQRRCAA
jgi:hypothetical protein